MKKIFKKLRVLSIVLLSLLLAVSVIGCNNNTTPANSGTTGGTTGDTTGGTTGGNTGGNTSGSTTTLQSQIDSAAAGSTVTLNASNSGTSIVINKALTVNGNNISGLTVVIASSVSDSVTLRNFSNATITVSSSSRRVLDNHMARIVNDTGDDELDAFQKITDGAVPLYLEGCTINKIEAETDLALYLENGDGKSEIEEIKLKDGAEDFTFIEIDAADKPETTGDEATPTESKSKVEKLSIESNEIEKINLIGGVFDDVDIADGFSGEPIDFKYDKEFDDQFGDDFDKDAFFGNGGNGDKIVEKDIGIAEKTATTGNVYSFTMSRQNFVTMNGFLSIVFMTPAQKQWMDDHQGSATSVGPRSSENFVEVISCATLENPMYLMMPAGLFTVENPEQATGLKTVYGSEYAYADYAHALARGVVGYYEEEDIVILDKYRNYNKDAVIVNFDGDTVKIYVDTAAVRKEDVILGNGAYSSDFEQLAEIGTKISNINLDDYVPYLAVDFGHTWENLPNGGVTHDSILIRKNMNTNDDAGRAQVEAYKTSLGDRYCSLHNMAAIYCQTLKMTRETDVELYHMTTDSYPDVSGVTYSSISTPTNKPNPFSN